MGLKFHRTPYYLSRLRIVAMCFMVLCALGAAAQGRGLTFALAGDVMMGTDYPEESKGIYLPADDGRGLLKDVDSLIRAADVAAINLEGTLFDTGGKPKECDDPALCYVFRTPQRYISNLTRAGVDFASLANNHVNDFGSEGLALTIRNLRNAGIACAGMRRSCPCTVIERAGKKIGFAAFAHNRGTLNIMDLDEVRRVVRQLKDTADIVLVSFHGGGEGPKFTRVPHAMEECFGEKRGDVELFAHTAIDAGADVVFGHGPHVTRAMELYRDRLIMYSLGNFCTPYRVNLKGVNGHAPLVSVTVDDSGRFIGGRIHPFIQRRGLGPRTDSSGVVVQQIRRLSKMDFPNSPLRISADGTLSRL